MAIAFFDLDKTLIPYNSASRWVRSEVRGGHMRRRTALRAFFWILRYHLGFADINRAMRATIATLRYSREAELASRTTEFYHRYIRGNYRPGALDAIAAHRKRNDTVVLLTSSSNYLAAAVAEELELDGYLCNRFVVDDNGLFTGEPVEPLCFDVGKVHYARTYADGRSSPLRECTYYGDSIADLPILDAVGKPMAVNPDRRLRRIAHKRGWPVTDWGSPQR